MPRHSSPRGGHARWRSSIARRATRDSRGRPPARCAPLLLARARPLSALHAPSSRAPLACRDSRNPILPSSSSAADPSRAPPVPVVLPRRASVRARTSPRWTTPEPTRSPRSSPPTAARSTAGNPGLANPTPGPGAYAMNALHPRPPPPPPRREPRHAAPRRAASSLARPRRPRRPGRGATASRTDGSRTRGGMPGAWRPRRPAAASARVRPPPPPLLSSPPPPRVGTPSPATPTHAPRRSKPRAPLVGGRDPSRTLRLAATERAAKHLDEASRFSSSRLSESAPRSASGSAVDVDSSISIDPVDARLAALERIARVEEASTSRAASRAAAIRASLERPDEALIRRRREARRRAKLDQIQDGWRDLLDVPGRNDRGRALDERRAGDGATPGPGAYDLARESREGPRDGASSSRGFGVTSKLGHQETRESRRRPARARTRGTP